MLERLILRNFKQFTEVEIELGDVVVFIGPNNSGKTSVLQALALWELGVRRWSEKRAAKTPPRKRSGVTINRRDLIALPVPETNLLWRNLRVREQIRDGKKRRTRNIRVDVDVEGITRGEQWSCGLEFDYGNSESLYCRPLGWADDPSKQGTPIPPQALETRVAYLQPMSGLVANETRLDRGAIEVRMGEGRTAEVLRNLCHMLAEREDKSAWEELTGRTRELFGCTIERPEYIAERGELLMSYKDKAGNRLDLSASGRGLQQTLLLLAFLLEHPGTVLLLDEPGAHLEILRQRQIYQSIVDVASKAGSQIIAASHSEVILNEAADRDIVIAFVGTPHRIDDRSSQAAKALKSIGFDQYYQAETRGWVLYVEGSTDLAILRGFARKLNHPAAAVLESPFVHYVENQPTKAWNHFFGLREAKKDLVGILITDRLDRTFEDKPRLPHLQWSRRELENYLAFPQVLEAYAESLVSTQVSSGELFERPERDRFREMMRQCVVDAVPPRALRDTDDRWWRETKATDDFLDPLFERFFAELDLPDLMRKTDYHRLVEFMPVERIDDEVTLVLDRILEVAQSATPRGE